MVSEQHFASSMASSEGHLNDCSVAQSILSPSAPNNSLTAQLEKMSAAHGVHGVSNLLTLSDHELHEMFALVQQIRNGNC